MVIALTLITSISALILSWVHEQTKVPIEQAQNNEELKAIEAVIGAIYLDSNFETAKSAVLSWYKRKFENAPELIDSQNPKGHLQEMAARKGQKVEYALLSADGPDHMKTFEVEVRIGGIPYGRASANSKKSAESKAAKAAIRDYGKAALSSKEMSDNGTITVTVPVINTGDVDGKETVQLYIQDEKSSLPRPVKELKGFRKIHLAPGQTTEVSFSITPDDLKFFDDSKHEWIAEPGKFKAMIGASSTDIRSTVRFSYK